MASLLAGVLNTNNDKGQEMKTIYTIGYGGRKPTDFVEILSKASVQLVADVRLLPNRASMGSYVKAKSPERGIEKLLGEAGIAYQWLEELGNPDPKDPQMQSFRDLMTEEFDSRTEQLQKLATSQTVCLLCAEKDPERCHRSIVTSGLERRGWDAVHL